MLVGSSKFGEGLAAPAGPVEVGAVTGEGLEVDGLRWWVYRVFGIEGEAALS